MKNNGLKEKNIVPPEKTETKTQRTHDEAKKIKVPRVK